VVPEGVRGRSLLERGGTPIEHRYDGGARLFRPAELTTLLRGQVRCGDVVAGLYAECAELDDVAKMQYVDLHTWLRGDILVKADRMSMAHSLELRVPFLDREVFDVAATIPVGLKLPPRSTQTKYALRQALRGVVPPAIVDRPKLGFPTPVRVWLRTEMYDWASGILSTSEAGGLLDLAYAQGLLERHRRGDGDQSRKVWAVLVFCLWYATATADSPRPERSTAG
jgi:asparagine synthase (glutamine-hydrolysing)